MNAELAPKDVALTDRTYLQTSEQWTRFLSALVHELRTPVASLRMLVDLLAEAPKSNLGDQEKLYVKNIEDVVQEVQNLIGETADLGRLLAGRVQLRPETVALEQLVDAVQEAVRPRAWEGGIALTSSLDPALSHGFHTDPGRLRQALTLLVGAAVSRAQSEVFFRLDFDDGDLRVIISWDGPPLEEAALTTFFEPFDHVSRTGRPRGGHRLALPVANELARALGGTLRAGNRGSRPTFDLSLPAGAR